MRFRVSSEQNEFLFVLEVDDMKQGDECKTSFRSEPTWWLSGLHSDLEQYKTALLDAGCDLSPLNYIKQWKAFTKMAATPANYGNSGVKPMGLFSRVMNSGSQLVMEGVKNLVLKQHVSKVPSDVVLLLLFCRLTTTTTTTTTKRR
ncbi:Sec1 family domain-containing protein 1 [Liparis tanakae]|uniref:Sec1 family domain-containing protein 1 n=1 Tax=Liparis tanakae TaxID=230148 RepID=A0A4Z2ECM2_9TELE|nr:Sec1 family domain-containing protein 1 [Liparis tanakae]